jgi:hypothetical protein
LQKALHISPSLRNLLLKFAQAFIVQTAHTAVANAGPTLTEVWRVGF